MAEWLNCSVLDLADRCSPALLHDATVAVRAEWAARQQRKGTAFED